MGSSLPSTPSMATCGSSKLCGWRFHCRIIRFQHWRRWKCQELALLVGTDLLVPAKSNRRALVAALDTSGKRRSTMRTFTEPLHLFQPAGAGSRDKCSQPKSSSRSGSWMLPAPEADVLPSRQPLARNVYSHRFEGGHMVQPSIIAERLARQAEGREPAMTNRPAPRGSG